MEIKFNKKEIEEIVCGYVNKKYRKTFDVKQWESNIDPDGIVVEELK